MINVKINGIQVQVPNNSTVLQACQQLNIEIPKFCFQDYLQIAGNCRMCLVEIENSPKPVASCAMPVMEGMGIYTNTPLVRKARESVLEFLLINHPLDCPICDQGGECDLQDQALTFGSDRSRFFFQKRGVEDKNVGPFIKTIMTRCIHCTRCVRFSNDICGVDDLGTTGRGTHTEIGFYLNKIFKSEFSGNVIDLCPVGALTSKPYAFKARSWELQKVDTIDILDSIGSNIQVHFLRNEIVRIIPQTNVAINLEWISNKTRFFFDSLKYQRIDYPLLKKDNQFQKISWSKAFSILQKELVKKKFNFQTVIGNYFDLKSLFYIKQFNNLLGSNNIIHESDFNKSNVSLNMHSEYLFQTNLQSIKNSDICLLVGCNPREEASILNIHLKNSVKAGKLEVSYIGPKVNLTYPSSHIGLSLNTFNQIIEGKHKFCQKIKTAKNPIFIFGQNFLEKENYAILEKFKKNIQTFSSKNNINILNTNASYINFLEIHSKKQKPSNFFFLFNTDFVFKKKENSFVVYQGHHFTENAQNSDLILPTVTFLEKEGFYINIEGLIQKTRKVLKLETEAKTDTNILKYLLMYLGFQKKIKQFNFFEILPYLREKVIKKTFFINKFNRILKNHSSTYIQPLHKEYYGVSVLERYSKTLMNARSFFKKSSHFN